MPHIFTRLLATVNVDNTWRWNSWIPDALVVNLGTNDGRAAVYPAVDYISTYTELVLNASLTYGPALHVFPSFVSSDFHNSNIALI